MISCTEFIPAYSEFFKYLEEKDGKKAVVAFWEYLSDSFLTNLKELVVKEGISGCWLYWSHTLNEEAADFSMILDEEAGEFSIEMHKCPSKGMLNEVKHIKPYRDYCQHCDVLYRRVLEPLGYRYSIDLSGCSQAQCTLKVSRI
ncbi:MAG: hypothetical protein A2Y21_01875 [Clostridiales bacterium GWC2_40_7]|nr:MAG: hypothetical protein A2Y21_01875 [Clostridiales bacterium GWC2_40_7]